MRVLCTGLVALLVATALASPAAALPPGYPDCCCVVKPQAPDACGCGFWCYSPCGMAYGPSYNVYPPFMPWNGG